MLLVIVCAFLFYVLADRGFLVHAFTLDRSYMVTLIAVLLLLATGHCAYHMLMTLRASDAIGLLLQRDSAPPAQALVDDFLRDIDVAGTDDAQGKAIIDIYADRLRAPVDIGWFLVDVVIRLGLLGTIIGFILIFSSLSSSSLGTSSEGLKDLLLLMSGGMGTALLTTLAGLVCATILSFQYLILGRQTEHLLAQLMRVCQRRQTASAAGR